MLEGQYKLEVEEGATPVVHPQRRVPVALKGKKNQLDCLQGLGIREEATEPTPWVSSLLLYKSLIGANSSVH